jgi:L-lactate dehydrogenase complex protein LldG
MSAAREELLARVRTAIAGTPRPPSAPRTYRQAGEHSPGSGPLLDPLEDRLLDYRATVHRTTAANVPAAIAAALSESVPDGGRVLVTPGLPRHWVTDATTDDGELTPADLDGFAAVVTACTAAAAETGTIVLDGSPDQGRRAITLVPDIHVCVVQAGQVVQSVPELLARLQPTRPLSFISGPSATSDIELQRVEGVHGPRTLIVVLVAN